MIPIIVFPTRIKVCITVHRGPMLRSQAERLGVQKENQRPTCHIKCQEGKVEFDESQWQTSLEPQGKVENFMFLPTFARKLINWLEGIILVRILFVLELKGTALQFVAIKAMERGNTTECTMYIDYTRFHLISFTSYTNIMYEHYTFCTHQRLCILCGSISYIAITEWVQLQGGDGGLYIEHTAPRP